MCNARGRFLNIGIGHLGSTLDYLAFATSSLHTKLERPGFLALNLVLYGDNAYVSNTYIVIPYKNVSDSSKETYNFYHSQVRIRIEYTFSILVHR